MLPLPFHLFSEHLVRLAFQCLQLVVTDFLPLMPWACLPLTVDTAAKFGSQTQELNISLTAIGLMVRVIIMVVNVVVVIFVISTIINTLLLMVITQIKQLLT